MNIEEAIEARISCRSYADRQIEQEKLDRIAGAMTAFNEEAGLHFQLYGPRGDGQTAIDMSAAMFAGPVYHYLALVSKEDDVSREKLGYYGEELILLATQLGLGTCWVASTFDRDTCRAEIESDEKLHCVVPLGYPAAKTPLKQKTIRAGLRLRDKKPADLLETDAETVPEWLTKAIECVIKGPSAINRQPILFTYNNGTVTATIADAGHGIEAIDLGIAKLHFEIGSGYRGTWDWGDGAQFKLKS